MCGVSGLMVLDGASLDVDPDVIAGRMADALVHRGPDSSGTWRSESGRVAFGHRRLAIVDLSDAGHQPMTSADGRWTITYNGELYNAADLRDRAGITASALRGHSDTEVLVEAIARVGVERVVELAIGMFAFVVHDRDTGELWFARDRFGEKPLYHTVGGGLLAFASELSALRVIPGFDARIDRCSLVELFERSVIRAPHTIYEGVSKLEAGTIARVDRSGHIRTTRYFDPTAVALAGAPIDRSDAAAIEELDELLGTIVAERTISDVPLGAFLSGGIDSSLIVAMMQRSSSTPTRTYTMGFESEHLDEAPAARRIAAALGTEHHEWIVSGSDALAVVPDLGSLYDEPFADSSQIPTTLVSRFARTEVTVALSGDGGDELFGGYERYLVFDRLARLGRLPPAGRRAAAAVLGSLPESTLDRVGRSRLARPLPRAFRTRTGRRVHAVADMLRAPHDLARYDLVMRLHGDGHASVRGGRHRLAPDDERLLGGVDPIPLGMIVDTVDYLPNDILTKVDRASMSTSLEVRAPMLDHRLHEFAWSLRPDQRVRDGVGKWLVREAVRRHVPEIADLPKRGFAVPLDEWLRGPLRSWAGDLLDASGSDPDRLLDGDAVHDLWNRHQDHRADLGAELWPIVMFQAWRAEQLSG